MKKILLLIIFSVVAGQLPAQQIRGTVTDEGSHRPLALASVFLPELKTGAATDSAGQFEINDIPAGSFLVEVSLVGYATKVIKLPADGTPATISLSASVTEMQELVVTGVASFTERARNPIPIVPLRREVMLQNISTNLIDAITRQPGVNQVSTGPAISKPVIRGLGYNRVVVLRNGMRQEGQQWGDEHGIEIDEYEVDRVEIIKGPGSLLYGSDAMAGVVNFLLPRTPMEGTQRGEWLTNYQSNGNLIGNSLTYSGMKNGFSYLGRFSQKKAGNFSNPVDGHVLNSGFEEYDGSMQLGLHRAWGYSQIQFSTYNLKPALTEGERDASGTFTRPQASGDSVIQVAVEEQHRRGYQNSVGVPYQRIAHNRILWTSNLFFGESNLLINLGWQQNRRREFGDALAPEMPEQHFLLNTFNADLKYYLPERNDWKITVGVSGQAQSNTNLGTEFLIPAYHAYDAGAFSFLQKTAGKWLFSGGLRFDYRSLSSDALYLDSQGVPVEAGTAGATTKFSAFDRTFGNVTGSAGLSYQMNAHTILRLNVSRGYRAPNLSELGSNGKHEGTFRYEIGNAGLKAETSLQSDVGVTVTRDHLTFDASIFYNRINQYVYLEKLKAKSGLDSIPDPSDPSPAYAFVQGNAELYGGEVSLDLHPHPLDWLHFENAFSMVRGIQLHQPDSMRNLPLMPAPKFQSEVRVQFNNGNGAIQQAYVKFDMATYFTQSNVYSAFQTETVTPGYTLFNAGAGCAWVNQKKRTVARIYLTATNLLDIAYQSHLSRLKYAPENPTTGVQGIYNAGRSFGIKLIFPFGD